MSDQHRRAALARWGIEGLDWPGLQRVASTSKTWNEFTLKATAQGLRLPKSLSAAHGKLRLGCFVCSKPSVTAGGIPGTKGGLRRLCKDHRPLSGRSACSIAHEVERRLLTELREVEAITPSVVTESRRREIVHALVESQDPDNPFHDPKFIARFMEGF